MSRRITLHVQMKLLSDTILGAGFSIPGGEDIAVRRIRTVIRIWKAARSRDFCGKALKTGPYGRAGAKRMWRS